MALSAGWQREVNVAAASLAIGWEAKVNVPAAAPVSFVVLVARAASERSR